MNYQILFKKIKICFKMKKKKYMSKLNNNGKIK